MPPKKTSPSSAVKIGGARRKNKPKPPKRRNNKSELRDAYTSPNKLVNNVGVKIGDVDVQKHNYCQKCGISYDTINEKDVIEYRQLFGKKGNIKYCYDCDEILPPR